ncbi:unnamed protein product [Meloidogyne enterolobii]|uniref:Uncharacterized protein n=1 Tax=Meloidogyne enterolobii TaxID=390850 RepID=A0ACB0YK66_MELEN
MLWGFFYFFFKLIYFFYFFQMTLSPILSIFFFSISQFSTFIFCSSPSSLRLISHKTNPGVAAVVAASKQKEHEEELMDEWAPYRMAFLLILVASSVALWASYKLLCEHPDDNEELQQRVIAYQPLRQNCNQLVLSLEGGGEGGHVDDEHKPFKNSIKNSLSFSSISSFDDENDLTCLLVGNEEIVGTKFTATATTTRLKKGLLSTGNI